VGLFLFEFIEGNTVTRVQFRRTLRRSRQAHKTGGLTDRDREEARTLLGRVTHFLDLPLFLAIIYCGAMRPGDWTHVSELSWGCGRGFGSDRCCAEARAA